MLLVWEQCRNCEDSWWGRRVVFRSLLYSPESVAILCKALQCCYGYIFEEEIYDTHMVISSLLPKPESLKCLSVSRCLQQTSAYTYTHWFRLMHKLTLKYTQSADPFRSPTVQFLQPIHLPQLSVNCQRPFEKKSLTHTHAHKLVSTASHTQFQAFKQIHTQ